MLYSMWTPQGTGRSLRLVHHEPSGLQTEPDNTLPDRSAELPTWPAERGAGEQMLSDLSEKPAEGDLLRPYRLKRPGDPCGD